VIERPRQRHPLRSRAVTVAGLSPTRPHAAAGILIEPPVSVPRVASAIPATTLAADRRSSVLADACRRAGCAPVRTPSPRWWCRSANSCRFVLPTMTRAGAARRETAIASSAHEPLADARGRVVTVPAMSKMSFTETGRRAAVPGPDPAASSRSASRACRRASTLAITRMYAFRRALSASIRRRTRLDHLGES
jgi:hypothetical protein